jgi:hypothetical protein
MAEKFGKMKYIVRNINVLIHFLLYKFQKHNSTIQRQDTIHSTMKTRHISKEIVSYKLRYL